MRGARVIFSSKVKFGPGLITSLHRLLFKRKVQELAVLAQDRTVPSPYVSLVLHHSIQYFNFAISPFSPKLDCELLERKGFLTHLYIIRDPCLTYCCGLLILIEYFGETKHRNIRTSIII